MREEDEEDGGVGDDPPAEEDWVVAVLEEEQLGCVGNHYEELEDLRGRHVSAKQELGRKFSNHTQGRPVTPLQTARWRKDWVKVSSELAQGCRA